MNVAAHRQELINHLNTEAERIRADAEARMASLHEAIKVLETVPDEIPDVPTAPGNDKSIPTLMREAALSLGDAVVFDCRILAERATATNPLRADEIKKKKHSAFAYMQTHGEIKRVQGGFQRTDKMKGRNADLPPAVATKEMVE